MIELGFIRVEDIKVVCAWGGEYMSGPVDAPPERTSHGICPKCLSKWVDDAAKGDPGEQDE